MIFEPIQIYFSVLYYKEIFLIRIFYILLGVIKSKIICNQILIE